MRHIAILGADIFNERREEAIFRDAGFEVSYYSVADPLTIADSLVGVEGLLVNLEKVTDDLLAKLPNVKAIGRYGVGVDNIDLEAASRRGIPVINVPDYCMDEVAEHAVSFIFHANRKLSVAAESVRGGVWGKVGGLKPIHSMREITLGVVGTGRIGMRVIEMMAPFGLNVVIYDPYLKDAKLPSNARLAELDDVFASSDIITIHCPLTEQTRHMFDADAFAKMIRRPAIVNVSRGPIINERDLLSALDEGQVSFAALDVLEKEPPDPANPLLHHKHALVTGHAAWYSEESEGRLQDLLSTRVIDSLEGRPVPTVANRQQLQNRA